MQKHLKTSWDLDPNQWTLCLLLPNALPIHNAAIVHIILLSLCPAPEQRAGCDHLDAAG